MGSRAGRSRRCALGLGEREDGTARFEEAYAACSAALQEYTRERFPLQWAKMEQGLGTALVEISERTGGIAQLEEAVVAYRAALQEYTQNGTPLEWASTQTNLGLAHGDSANEGPGRRSWRKQSRPIARRFRMTLAMGFR